MAPLPTPILRSFFNIIGSWFMVHTKAAYRPLGMQGASGLRDTPGHTSRSLQRTNVIYIYINIIN